MGALSATNQRALVVFGHHTGVPRDFMTTDYVNIVGAPGEYGASITTTAVSVLGLARNGIDAAVENLVVSNTQGDKWYFPSTSLPRITSGFSPKAIAPTFVELFDDSTDWTKTGTAGYATLSTDTTEYYRAGNASCKLAHIEASGGKYNYIGRQITGTSFQYCSFHIRYYVDADFLGWGQVADFYAYFFNGTSFATGTEYARMKLPMSPGWNEIDFCASQMLTSGTFDWSSNVQYIAFYTGVTDGTPAWDLHWDLFEVRPHGRDKGAVVFTFDDAVISQRTVVAPYMQKYGYPFHIFAEMRNCVHPTSGYMTLAQLRECETMGAIISVHENGKPWSDKGTLVSDERVRQWCAELKENQVRYGYTQGTSIFAIPGGSDYLQAESHVLAMREYFQIIRGTEPFRGPAIVDDEDQSRYSQPAGGHYNCFPWYPRENFWAWATWATNNANFNATMLAILQRASANRDVVILYGHAIGDVGGESATVARFQQLVDDVNSGADVDMDVLTLMDVMQ
jgi:hypothetical protein